MSELSEVVQSHTDGLKVKELKKSAYLSALPIAFYFLLTLFFTVYLVVKISFALHYGLSSIGIAEKIVYSLIVYLGVCVCAGLWRPVVGYAFFCLRSYKKESPSLVLDEKESTLLIDTLLSEKKSLLNENDIVLDKVILSSDVVLQIIPASKKSPFSKKLLLMIGAPFLSCFSIEKLSALVQFELLHYANTNIPRFFLMIRWCRECLYYCASSESAHQKTNKTSSFSTILYYVFIPYSIVTLIVTRYFSSSYNVVAGLTRQALSSYIFSLDDELYQTERSQSYIQALSQLVAVDQAFHQAANKIFSESLFPDDLSLLIKQFFSASSAKKSGEVELSELDYFTHFLLYPPLAERIKRLGLRDKKMGLNDAASTAFLHALGSTLEATQKKLTQVFYDFHSLNVSAEQLVVMRAEPGQDVEKQDKNARILNTFTNTLFFNDVVWDIPYPNKFADLPSEKIIRFTNRVITSIRHNLPEFTHYQRGIGWYKEKYQYFHFAHWLIKDGSHDRPSYDELEPLHEELEIFKEKTSDAIALYKRLWGVRVSAALVLDKQEKHLTHGKKLLAMLRVLSQLEKDVQEGNYKSSTLAQLVARRKKEARIHDRTIARFHSMLLKSCAKMERVLMKFPAGLITLDTSVITQQSLIPSQLKQKDAELMVIKRFKQLCVFYEAFNVALSAEIANFAQRNEEKFGAVKLVTVAIPTSNVSGEV